MKKFIYAVTFFAFSQSMTNALAKEDDCNSLTGTQSEAVTFIESKLVNKNSQIEGVSIKSSICRVRGIARPSADSEIKFEVWLPESHLWTRRMKLSGTGGFSGGIPYSSLSRDVSDGFVAAGSNMGHDGGESPSWTMGHPEKVKDWGLRAHYYVATAAKNLGIPPIL